MLWISPSVTVYTRSKVSVETSTTQPSHICLRQAYYEIDIWVWLKDGLDRFKMRSNLELEPWGESITDGFILIYLIAKKRNKKVVWLRRREWEDGFILIHLIEKKKGFDREEEDVEDEKMGFGYWSNGFTHGC